jgi:hypothetical protein
MAAATGRSRAGWTLPDDGIIDMIAIEIAANGVRPVPLTPAERHLAAARILANGGGTSLICRRLHVSGSTARRLAASIRAGSPPLTDPERRAVSPAWPSPAFPASSRNRSGRLLTDADSAAA